MCAFTICVSFSKLSNLFVSQLALAILYSNESSTPAFSSHVVMVLFRSTKEKMVRIYINWIIARVTHEKPFRDFPI